MERKIGEKTRERKGLRKKGVDVNGERERWEESKA